MTHAITNLCIREGSCANVCPVDCIVAGKPQEKYPQFYIDPVTCIDCGACVSACPYGAIFPEFDIPRNFVAKGSEILTAPEGTPGFDNSFELKDNNFKPVILKFTRTMKAGEQIDFSPSIQVNADYFSNGPGYGN